MGFIKNLKPSWASILAIAIACTCISYHNNKQAEEYQKEQYIHQINIPKFEDVFEAATTSFDSLEIDPIIVPEGLDLEEEVEEEVTEETGFHK